MSIHVSQVHEMALTRTQATLPDSHWPHRATSTHLVGRDSRLWLSK